MYSMNKILSLSVCAVGVSFSVLQRLNLCLPATFGCMVIKKNPIENPNPTFINSCERKN